MDWPMDGQKDGRMDEPKARCLSTFQKLDMQQSACLVVNPNYSETQWWLWCKALKGGLAVAGPTLAEFELGLSLSRGPFSLFHHSVLIWYDDTLQHLERPLWELIIFCASSTAESRAKIWYQ